jgi:hypothetical protein
MALFGVDIKDLGSAVGSIGSGIKDIRAAITGKAVIDPAAQAQLEMKLMELEAAANSAQVNIDAVEAASPSLFVSGWRPFIGWICGLAIAYSFLAYPLLKPLVPTLVLLDMEQLWPLVLGMLGLGTLRTAEKFKDKARS